MTRQSELIALIREVRMTADRLRESNDFLHEDVAITPAMRAVIETIEEGGPQTVPHIARMRDVSRQHIQQLVDALVGTGLIELRDNPAHRRSPLIALTETGRAEFAAMRRREALAIKAILAALDQVELAKVLSGMTALNKALASLDPRTIRRQAADQLRAA